mmetsp:Transcript_10838/g.16455  ORF Transcript_10838/g.16455 Transcript_10838/m.16455 type:complete len:150 (+) Transcript_10838:1659-2108(+)
MAKFETSSSGFEWFANSPGHETLTSYGLAQFQDMMDVSDDIVDETTISRTVEWLWTRKNPEKPGSFILNPRTLDTFGSSTQEISDAYIVWVLTTLKNITINELTVEFQYLHSLYQNSTDPYFMSLYCGALHNVGMEAEASSIAQLLTVF